MMQQADPEPMAAGGRTGFTRQTRRALTAMRVIAYSLATLFMVVMVVRGLWLTQDQLEADARRAAVAAVPVLEGLAAQGRLDPASGEAALARLAVPGAQLRLVPAATAVSAAGERLAPLGDSGYVLASGVDDAAIRAAAWDVNLPYILLVAALGIPTIIIFLLMGWLVNEPALRLLAYAQAETGEDHDPPALPALWEQVVERLRLLRESQARMQAFLDNAPVPMAFLDPASLRLTMINRCGADYFGLEPEALLACEAGELAQWFPDQQQVVSAQLRRLQTSGAVTSFETRFRRGPDQLADVRSTVFPVLGRDGAVAQIGWIMVDVTEERLAQGELARSTTALHQSEKLAALGAMLAGVSHELNNPLAAVIGQAALLAEDLEETPHAPRIAKIRRAADRCARIVQSFLAMARQKDPEYRLVTLDELVLAAVELTEYQMRAADIAIALDLKAGPRAIRADPDQLHQVIVNLLTNARQALEDSPAARRIAIATARSGNAVRLTIADNGKGIDPALRDRIFDPFFTTKAPGAGTGIGLSYSLGIVEAHGGTLGIVDRPAGTEFEIVLPVREGRGEAAPDARAPQAALSGKVLVIDDEEDVAETLADMLARMGLSATIAIGGRAGQAALAGGAPFDLVMSDIRMPDCDGPTLYHWLCRERPELAGRIAFVTGDTLSGVAAQFIAQSRCPLLEKPFTPAALRALVAQLGQG